MRKLIGFGLMAAIGGGFAACDRGEDPGVAEERREDIPEGAATGAFGGGANIGGGYDYSEGGQGGSVAVDPPPPEQLQTGEVENAPIVDD